MTIEYDHYFAVSFLPAKNSGLEVLNGKVVAKFIVGKVEEINKEAVYPANEAVGHFVHTTQSMNDEQLLKASCLSQPELQKYIINSSGYAHEITHLEIFDRPRELGEFHFTKEYKKAHDFPEWWDKPITHAPQSWQYALVEE